MARTRSFLPCTGAALALLALVACQPATSDGGAAAARFEVHPVQGTAGPAIVRFDTATGALERAPLVGARSWTQIGEAAVESGPAGRFGFTYAQTKAVALTFVRFDTETGEVWRLSWPRDRAWLAYRSNGDAAPPPPSPRRETRETPTPPPAPKAAQPAKESANAKPPVGRAVEDIPAYVQGLEATHIPMDMRAWAVEQLGNVESTEAVAPLLGALEYEDPMILRSAIRALAKHDDPRVKPAIERMTKHSIPEVARVAATTLSTLQ